MTWTKFVSAMRMSLKAVLGCVDAIDTISTFRIKLAKMSMSIYSNTVDPA